MRKEIRYGEILREKKNVILDCAQAGSTWLFSLPLVQYKNLETFGKYSGDCVNNTEFKLYNISYSFEKRKLGWINC